ncbi:MAG TPA: serine hydrolase [Candidatus Paceibacterota bacterium]|nr:serine hydrolase [Candidatus Paceibacterota bacterium]
MQRNDFKLIVIFAIVGFLIGPKIFASQKSAPNEKELATQPAAIAATSSKPDPFTGMSLTAKSAFVWDIASQRVLYAKNAQSPQTLASITKMMTAVVALESTTADGEVTIRSDDLAVEGSTDLRKDERWSLKDLLALTLVESSNHGASAIAASVGAALDSNKNRTRDEQRDDFVAAMNAKSKQIGLNSFAFTSPSGLDAGSTPGGSGSAHDVAKLFEYILRHHSSLLQYTAQPIVTVTSKQHIAHRVANTNEIAAATPGIIGGKTGYTDMAGGNLAIIVDIGIQQPVVIVALGSTREQRFTDVQALLAAAKLAMNN